MVRPADHTLSYTVYGVRRRDREPVLRFIHEALAASGCRIIRSSEADHAPFRISFETGAGERMGIIAYAFFANNRDTKNRPKDEYRFQLKYGGKQQHNLHHLWQDPYGLYTTILVGISPSDRFFVGFDPVLHSPTKHFISLEFKRSFVDEIGRNGWSWRERDRRSGSEEPVEVIVGGTMDSFVDFVRFERERAARTRDTAPSSPTTVTRSSRRPPPPRSPSPPDPPPTSISSHANSRCPRMPFLTLSAEPDGSSTALTISTSSRRASTRIPNGGSTRSRSRASSTPTGNARASCRATCWWMVAGARTSEVSSVRQHEPGKEHLMSARKPQPKVISLFSGAGGLDYGFEVAGFETRFANDFDPDSCETLRRNRDWCVVERSIFEVPTEEILSKADLDVGEADVLIGGPPCQPFSKSSYWARGDAARLNDPRAATLDAYLRVLEEVQPRAFLLENVYGIAYSDKNEGLQLLLNKIAKINQKTGTRYQPVLAVLNAAWYGVPQLRERFFLVAARDGSHFDFPKPTFAPPSAYQQALGTLPSYRTAWDALADVDPSPDEELALRGKWAGLLPSIPEGQNYLHHTERGDGMPLFGWRRRYWNFLLKLAKRLPSWTIQAQPGPSVGPFHWENRRLSHRELCRLQTFPDDVQVYGTRMSVQRQVGNAVPSLLAEVLAREIKTQLLGYGRTREPLRLLPPDRSPAPPPERVRAVPAVYEKLAGQHQPHPGTGKGPRSAQQRGHELFA